MFITLEGPDASGKTTFTKKLKSYFESVGIEAVFTREPGSEQRVNQKIRKVILNKKNEMSAMTEALLYAADRRQNLETIIWPALKSGKIVICDRFIDSSLVYQGHARGLGIEKIYDLQMLITDNTIPDLTLFFDINPNKSSVRMNNDNREDKDRLESQGMLFIEKVYEGYKKILELYNNRIKRIDASLPPEELFEEGKKIIIEKIKK